MKQRVEEMEKEASKLRELQAAAEQAEKNGEEGAEGVPMETEEDKAAADSRSVYVGNVSLSHDATHCTLTEVCMVIGRLCFDPRGDPTTFPSVWDHQSCDDHL